MISIVIIIQADSAVSDTNEFVSFCLQLLPIRGERYKSGGAMLTILCWHPLRAAHLVVSNIWSHLCRSWRKLISSHQIRKSQLHALTAIPQLPVFQIPKNSLPISSRHDVIHPFNCVSSSVSCLRVYYYRWWLSYPLGAGMRVHRLTTTPEPRDTG